MTNDVSANSQLKAITSALAGGAISPSEARRIAGVVDTFVRAIETIDFDPHLQELGGRFKTRDAAAGTSTGSAWPYNR